jgi:elongation factor Ts
MKTKIEPQQKDKQGTQTAITIEMIKQLRAETGAGIQDCCKALEQANANYEKAREDLREKAQVIAVNLANRPASYGRLELYSHGNGRIGVMVEIHTETDFAGRSGTFAIFAHEIALQIAAEAPIYVRDEDIPAEVLAQEIQKVSERARSEGKPEAIIARIVEGFLKKYKDEHVLLRQAYIRDDKMTVAQLLSQAVASVDENIVIRRFIRWELEGDEAASS